MLIEAAVTDKRARLASIAGVLIAAELGSEQPGLAARLFAVEYSQTGAATRRRASIMPVCSDVGLGDFLQGCAHLASRQKFQQNGETCAYNLRHRVCCLPGLPVEIGAAHLPPVMCLIPREAWLCLLVRTRAVATQQLRP